MLITRPVNTASIKLTTPIKAADEGNNKTTIHIKAVEGVYTEEINDIEKVREQDSCRKDTISAIN